MSSGAATFKAGGRSLSMANILILCAVTWVAMAGSVIGLALYRRYISREEFDTLHAAADTRASPEQD
jgi:hypothetical protein